MSSLCMVLVLSLLVVPRGTSAELPSASGDGVRLPADGGSATPSRVVVGGARQQLVVSWDPPSDEAVADEVVRYEVGVSEAAAVLQFDGDSGAEPPFRAYTGVDDFDVVASNGTSSRRVGSSFAAVEPAWGEATAAPLSPQTLVDISWRTYRSPPGWQRFQPVSDNERPATRCFPSVFARAADEGGEFTTTGVVSERFTRLGSADRPSPASGTGVEFGEGDCLRVGLSGIYYGFRINGHDWLGHEVLGVVQDMLRTFVGFRKPSLSDTQGVGLTLGGLAPGRYRVTTYHLGRNNGLWMDVNVTDADGSRVTQTDLFQPCCWTPDVSQIARTHSIRVNSTSHDVTISLVPLYTGREYVMNGFTLERYSPSTAVWNFNTNSSGGAVSVGAIVPSGDLVDDREDRGAIGSGAHGGVSLGSPVYASYDSAELAGPGAPARDQESPAMPVDGTALDTAAGSVQFPGATLLSASGGFAVYARFKTRGTTSAAQFAFGRFGGDGDWSVSVDSTSDPVLIVRVGALSATIPDALPEAGAWYDVSVVYDPANESVRSPGEDIVTVFVGLELVHTLRGDAQLGAGGSFCIGGDVDGGAATRLNALFDVVAFWGGEGSRPAWTQVRRASGLHLPSPSYARGVTTRSGHKALRVTMPAGTRADLVQAAVPPSGSPFPDPTHTRGNAPLLTVPASAGAEFAATAYVDLAPGIAGEAGADEPGCAANWTSVTAPVGDGLTADWCYRKLRYDSDEPISADDADALCMAYSAQLVSVHSDDEATAVADTCGDDVCWVSGRIDGGQMSWRDGSDWDYSITFAAGTLPAVIDPACLAVVGSAAVRPESGEYVAQSCAANATRSLVCRKRAPTAPAVGSSLGVAVYDEMNESPALVVSLTGAATALADNERNPVWDAEDRRLGRHYMGCYQDSSTRALAFGYIRDTNSMTVDYCVNHCRNLGYPFAGVEYYYECFCGHTYDLHNNGNPRPESECSTACRGDPTQICGGSWRLSVYSAQAKVLEPAKTAARLAVATHDVDYCCSTPCSSAQPVSCVPQDSLVKRTAVSSQGWLRLRRIAATPGTDGARWVAYWRPDDNGAQLLSSTTVDATPEPPPADGVSSGNGWQLLVSVRESYILGLRPGLRPLVGLIATAGTQDAMDEGRVPYGAAVDAYTFSVDTVAPESCDNLTTVVSVPKDELETTFGGRAVVVVPRQLDSVMYEATVTAVFGDGQRRSAPPAWGRAGVAGLPETVSEFLRLHLDASTFAEATDVSRWDDTSGRRQHVYSSGAGRMPSVVENSFNGRSAMHFTDRQTMWTTVGATGLDPMEGSMTVFVVARPDTLSRFQFLVSRGSYSQWDYGWMMSVGRTGASGIAGARARPSTGGNRSPVSSGVDEFSDTTAPHIWAFTFVPRKDSPGDRDILFFLDGSSEDSTNVYSISRTLVQANHRVSRPTTRFHVADGYSSQGYSFQGDMQEVILYNEYLDHDARTDVFDYLTEKYSLSCPDISSPNVTSSASSVCQGARAGDRCTQQCAPGFARVAGAFEKLCTAGVWDAAPLRCAATCEELRVPDGALGCVETLYRADFTSLDTLFGFWTELPAQPPGSPTSAFAIEAAGDANLANDRNASGYDGDGAGVPLTGAGEVMSIAPVIRDLRIVDQCGGYPEEGAALVLNSPPWETSRQAMKVTLRTFVPTGAVAEVIFRRKDANNYYSFTIDGEAGTLTLFKTLAGVKSQLGTQTAANAGVVFDAWQTVRVELDPSAIRVYMGRGDGSGIDTGTWAVRPGDQLAAVIRASQGAGSGDDEDVYHGPSLIVSVDDADIGIGTIALRAFAPGARFASVLVTRPCETMCGGTAAVGTECSMFCGDGYRAVGSSRRACTAVDNSETAQWSGDASQCQLEPPEFRGLTVGFSYLGSRLRYDQAQDFCSARGNQLCTIGQLCGGPRFDVIPGDHWVPIADAENEWIQVGTSAGRTCMTHIEAYGAPTWGESTDAAAWKGLVACCVDDSSVASRFYDLGDTITYDSARAFCSSVEGGSLCPASLLCGEVSPLFNPVASNHWVPIGDSDNNWVQISDRQSVPLCTDYLGRIGATPTWGRDGSSRSWKGLLACCPSTTEGPSQEADCTYVDNYRAHTTSQMGAATPGIPSEAACCHLCQSTTGCLVWVWYQPSGSCTLHSGEIVRYTYGAAYVSGYRQAIKRSVVEMSPKNTEVGLPIEAFSRAMGAAVTYTIADDGENIDDAFKVGICDGQLAVASDVIDYETNREYALTVRATVGGDALANSTALVWVSVVDANDPPTMPDQRIVVFENSPVGSIAGTVSAYDEENDALLYYITSGNDEGIFSITTVAGTGVGGVGQGRIIVARDVLDYETKRSYVLLVTVRERSDASSEATAFVVVDVADANDAPVIAPGQEFFLDETLANPVYNTGLQQMWAPLAATDQEGHSVTFSVQRSFVKAASAGLTYHDGTETAVAPPSSAPFTVDGTNGNLAFAYEVVFPDIGVSPPVPVLGYTCRAAYDVLVEAEDSEGETSVANVTVYLLANLTQTSVPSVLSMEGVESGAATTGGDEVRFTGINLGNLAANVTALYAQHASPFLSFEAANCFVEEAHTVISCTTAPGAGANHKWALFVDGEAVASTIPLVMSYLPPAVDSVTTTEPGVTVTTLSTIGNGDVVLSGTSFGPPGDSGVGLFVRVRYGPPGDFKYSATVVSVTQTSLQCRTASGVGANLEFQISVAGQTVNAGSRVVVSYAPPVIERLERWYQQPAFRLHTMATSGYQWMRIWGRNFGSYDDPFVATYGGPNSDKYTAYRCRHRSTQLVVANTDLICQTVPGVGGDLGWKVTVGGQTSASSHADGVEEDNTMSYSRPVVTQLQGPGVLRASTAGGEAIILRGQNFGPVGPLDGSLTYGNDPSDNPEPPFEYAATNCAVVNAHTIINCLTAPGTGAGHSWLLEIAGQQGAVLPAGTSYAAPIMADMQPAAVGRTPFDFDTPGSEVVIVDGRNFGADDSKIGRVWYERERGTPNAQDYRFEATDCTITVPHVQMRCSTAPGAGTNLQWFSIIDDQESEKPTSAYGIPEVHQIVPSEGLSPLGGEWIVITGKNFATAEHFEGVTFGPAGDDFAFTNCYISEPHAQISCQTLPGAGAQLSVVVTVAAQASLDHLGLNAENTTISYRPPVLDGITPTIGPTGGGYIVTLSGRDFGPEGSVRIEFGQREGAGWPQGALGDYIFDEIAVVSFVRDFDDPSQVTLQATIPEQQGLHWGIRVVSGYGLVYDPSVPVSGANAQASAVYQFEYEAPVLERVVVTRAAASLVDPVDLPLLGLQVTDETPLSHVRMYGRNFGMSNTSSLHGSAITSQNAAYVSALGDYAALSIATSGAVGLYATATDDRPLDCLVLAYAHTEIECVTARAVGDVWVRAGLRFSNSLSFRFLSPHLTDVTVELAEHPTTGGGRLFIDGSFLGSEQTTTVTVGGRVCEILEFTDLGVVGVEPLGRITCSIPAGQGANQEIVVRNLDLSSEPPMFYDYDPPVITSMTPTEGNTDGSTVITVTGQNFGLASAGAGIIFGAGVLTAPVVSHGTGAQEHTTLYFNAPETTVGGVNFVVRVVVAGQISSASTNRRFDYSPPSVTSITTTSGAAFTASTVGGDMFLLHGSSFARMGTVAIGGRPTTCTLWTHALLTCIAPEGTGGQQDILVTVGSQNNLRDDPAVMFDYTAPNIRTLSRSSAPSSAVDLDLSGLPEGFAGLYGETPPEYDSVSERDRAEATAQFEYEAAFADAVANQASPITLTIRGDNFGDARPGVLFKRGFLTRRVRVISWTHVKVEFQLPEGFGRGWAVQVLAPDVDPEPDVDSTLDVNPSAQHQLSNAAEFNYEVPRLLAMHPAQGPTDGCNTYDEFGSCYVQTKLTLWGVSLGIEVAPGVENGGQVELAVLFGPHAVVVVPPGQQPPAAEPGVITASVVEWSHHHITFTLPPGIGTDIPVAVAMDEQAKQAVAYVTDAATKDLGTNLVDVVGTTPKVLISNLAVFNYDPPLVMGVLPWPFNAEGDFLRIAGRNFGASPSDLNITVGGVQCLDAQWQSPFSGTGSGAGGVAGFLPFLTCTMPRTTVGYKNGSVTVAGQTASIPGPGVVARPQLYARCVEGDYAQAGEYCVPCDFGSTCEAKVEPPYFLDNLPCMRNVTHPVTKEVRTNFPCEETYSEPVADEGFWVTDVNVSVQDALTLGCHEERLSRDSCPTVVPCEPRFACEGNNSCLTGYEHLKPQCEAAREQLGAVTCSSHKDCNPLASVDNPLTGCTVDTPENCAICVGVDVVAGTVMQHRQTCQCVPAPRCSLCTVGSYFRDAGECVECPDNPWLLIIFFLLAVIVLCVGGYVLNRCVKCRNASASTAVAHSRVLTRR